MNDEQNIAPEGEQTGGASEPATTDTDLRAPNNLTADESGTPNDEYYAVDYAKKDVVSTIGDGEMHNEGLAGEPDTAADLQSSEGRMADEQDRAERYDSQG
jgi:hypothetical protein